MQVSTNRPDAGSGSRRFMFRCPLTHRSRTTGGWPGMSRTAAYERASQVWQRRMATRSVLPCVARNGSDSDMRDHVWGSGLATQPNFGGEISLSERWSQPGRWAFPAGDTMMALDASTRPIVRGGTCPRAMRGAEPSDRQAHPAPIMRSQRSQRLSVKGSSSFPSRMSSSLSTSGGMGTVDVRPPWHSLFALVWRLA